MAVALDSSALLKRYLFEPGHELVNEYLRSDSTWCASALARTEVQLALHRVASDLEEQRRLWSTFREDWERIAVVPTDQRCLARAVEIGATFLLGTIDALHLAAADRLRLCGELSAERHGLHRRARLPDERARPACLLPGRPFRVGRGRRQQADRCGV